MPRHRPRRSPRDATDSNDAIVVSLNWEEIRRFVWSYVGIARSDKRIEILRDEIRAYYLDFRLRGTSSR